MENQSESPLKGLNVNRMIEQWNLKLAGMLTNFVSKLSLGIVDEDCSTTSLAVVIHCMENFDIFDDKQIGNILAMLNKLSYE